MKLGFLLPLIFAVSACSRVERGPASADYPITVVGGDESSFTPARPGVAPIKVAKQYDAVVVGAGLSGLSAAVFLSDAGKSVLVLEKEDAFGGLAQGTTFPGTDVRFDRGAAYWTSSYEEEQEILNRIGLGDYEKKHPIPEPIDSYFWEGKFYPGIWEEETMKALPASFAVFHHELKKANEEGIIPNQPIEEQADTNIPCDSADAHKNLDCIDTHEWIRSMPKTLAKHRDKEGREIYARFKEELASGRLDKKDPMSGVIGLMDLYCRSALGTTGEAISAVAFANFYISEIETRYTTQIGTAQAAENMVKVLRGRTNLVNMNSGTPVLSIVNKKDHAETTYVMDGKAYVVHSKYVVFAAQLKFAPQIIRGFEKDRPDQAELMKGMQYANYSVHAVEVKGHPYRATYDTWTRSSDATNQDFTDIILGRWMDPTINGYDGYRDFKQDPEGNAIMTIYHPLPLSVVGKGYTEDQAKETARFAVGRMLDLYNPFLAARWNTRFDVLSVQTSRWPYSVHVAAPGHFAHKVKIMRKPYGHVFFGNNNLGTPAFEEALFRGHCAADNVLARMDKNFQREKWSQCPIEK